MLEFGCFHKNRVLNLKLRPLLYSDWSRSWICHLLLYRHNFWAIPFQSWVAYFNCKSNWSLSRICSVATTEHEKKGSLLMFKFQVAVFSASQIQTFSHDSVTKYASRKHNQRQMTIAADFVRISHWFDIDWALFQIRLTIHLRQRFGRSWMLAGFGKMSGFSLEPDSSAALTLILP